jgi:DNA polymerase-3 subunit delta'
MPSGTENANLIDSFKDGFKSGKMGHAYLIVGDPRGNAAQLAENVLQMIFCISGNPPCGRCNTCRRVAGHIHPDVSWIEPIKKSRGILVEQIKDLIRNTFETTFEGGWKAIVLVSAERMNNEAGNKLLKTLEEPPPRTVFFLLTDQPEALLPTIISRCQRVVLSVSLAESESKLQSSVVKIAAGLTSGRITVKLTQARALLSLLKSIRDQSEKDEDALMAQNQISAEQVDDLDKVREGRIEAIYRERRGAVLKLLLLWQRDLLLCASGINDENFFFFRSEASQIRAAANGLSVRQAMNNINIVENIQEHLNQHLSEFMVMERAFLQLAACSACSESGRGISSGRAAGEEGNASLVTN